MISSTERFSSGQHFRADCHKLWGLKEDALNLHISQLYKRLMFLAMPGPNGNGLRGRYRN